MLQKDVNIYTQSGEKPDIYFQVESNLSKYQMPESRNLGLKRPGHANKPETASRKNQTGFDRQKINNEK